MSRHRKMSWTGLSQRMNEKEGGGGDHVVGASRLSSPPLRSSSRKKKGDPADKTSTSTPSKGLADEPSKLLMKETSKTRVDCSFDVELRNTRNARRKRDETDVDSALKDGDEETTRSLELDIKKKKLAAQAVRLKRYKDVVLRYEELAEEATKEVLRVRANNLIELEQELEAREQDARRKLVNAARLLEESQAAKQGTVQTVQGTEGSDPVGATLDSGQELIAKGQAEAGKDFPHEESHLMMDCEDEVGMSETAGKGSTVSDGSPGKKEVVKTSTKGRKSPRRHSVRSTAVAPLTQTDLETQNVPVVNTFPEQPVDQHLTTGKGGKRGRKRKQPEKSTSAAASLRCGKCNEELDTKIKFARHVAKVHGGIARPFGESQEFTEPQRLEACKAAFKHYRDVPCFACGKTYSSFLGIKYHWVKCGKSNDELEESKVKCRLCDYKALVYMMPYHVSTMHPKVEKSAVDDAKTSVEAAANGDVEAQLTASGRKSRKASRKARFLLASNAAVELAGKQGDDDDEFRPHRDWSSMYSKENNVESGETRFKCLMCDEKFSTLPDIFDHFKCHDEVGSDKEFDDLCLERNEDDDDEEEEEEGEYGDENLKVSGAQRERPLVLYKEMKSLERSFRVDNFDKFHFDFFHTVLADWKLLNNSDELEPHLPAGKTSCHFRITFHSDSKIREGEIDKLERFRSMVDGNGHFTLFAGGPIWAGDWCPFHTPPGGGRFNILALSADPEFENFHVAGDGGSTPTKGLIQLWNVARSGGVTMRVGIAHEFGKVWKLRWCPSGCQNESPEKEGDLPRLGLLAAACSDGTVRVISVPQFEHLMSPESVDGQVFYRAEGKAVKTLQVTTRPSSNVHCLDVCWYRGTGHKVVAAAFSNGDVALWNVATESRLLRLHGGSHLLPYLWFRAHGTGSRVSLDLSGESLSDGQKELPRYLVTGGSDRAFAIWDLGDVGSGPVCSAKRNNVTDVKWLHHYPGHVSVAYEDTYTLSFTRSCIVDVAKMEFVPTFCQNSTVWSQAHCPVKNVTYCCTSAGEVMLFVAAHPTSSLVNDKHSGERRLRVFKTNLHFRSVAASPRPANDDNERRRRREQEAEIAFEPRYDFKDRGGLVMEFVDIPVKDFEKAPAEASKVVRNNGLLATENPLRYPYSQFNCVSVNPNIESSDWLFSGCQAGLGRIHQIKGFKR